MCVGGGGGVVVSFPDPDSQQLRVDYITATWKVGLGNKNDALVPSVPKHWDGCVLRHDNDVTLIADGRCGSIRHRSGNVRARYAY